MNPRRKVVRSGWIIFLLTLLLPLTASPAPQKPPQGKDQPVPPAADASKDQPLPLKPARSVEFTTDQGTWLSLDVSPDGKTILFELVGDLYTIAFSGGEARKLTSGMAFNSQPRYSPDGKKLSSAIAAALKTSGLPTPMAPIPSSSVRTRKANSRHPSGPPTATT